MTHDEQHKMIVSLMEVSRRMKRYDQEEFEMFVKRDKDDEDLDTVSQKKLVRLFDQYIGPGRDST
ncbi:MAG: hypothetical protein AB1428_12615 [Bacteroidota bacterium]